MSTFSMDVVGSTSGPGGVPNAGLPPEQAAQQLEGLFLSMLVKEMRSTSSESGLFGSGPGSSIYEGFFDSLLGESLASGAGTGLRESILASIAPPEPPRDELPPQAPSKDLR